jgi:hypothetical protein
MQFPYSIFVFYIFFFGEAILAAPHLRKTSRNPFLISWNAYPYFRDLQDKVNFQKFIVDLQKSIMDPWRFTEDQWGQSKIQRCQKYNVQWYYKFNGIILILVNWNGNFYVSIKFACLYRHVKRPFLITIYITYY